MAQLLFEKDLCHGGRCIGGCPVIQVHAQGIGLPKFHIDLRAQIRHKGSISPGFTLTLAGPKSGMGRCTIPRAARKHVRSAGGQEVGTLEAQV